MTAANELGHWAPLRPCGAATLLRDYPGLWWIAGGWALDLFAGKQTREHDDLDVEVLRRDQRAIQRHLAGWDLHVAHAGMLRPWRAGEELAPPFNSVWGRPRPGAPWAMQIMFASAEGSLWRYRRCEAITHPLSTLGGWAPTGVPYLAPHIQLLYKSRGRRPKDERDFAAVLPMLDAQRRSWLAAALLLVEPGHRWIDALVTTHKEANDDVARHRGAPGR